MGGGDGGEQGGWDSVGRGLVGGFYGAYGGFLWGLIEGFYGASWGVSILYCYPHPPINKSINRDALLSAIN